MADSTESADKQAAKPDLGLLEEDDEFEEFPAEDWTGADEDQGDVTVWEDNWDDNNVEDDFSQQLKAELEKKGQISKSPAEASAMQHWWNVNSGFLYSCLSSCRAVFESNDQLRICVPRLLGIGMDTEDEVRKSYSVDIDSLCFSLANAVKTDSLW